MTVFEFHPQARCTKQRRHYWNQYDHQRHAQRSRSQPSSFVQRKSLEVPCLAETKKNVQERLCLCAPISCRLPVWLVMKHTFHDEHKEIRGSEENTSYYFENCHAGENLGCCTTELSQQSLCMTETNWPLRLSFNIRVYVPKVTSIVIVGMTKLWRWSVRNYTAKRLLLGETCA